MTTTQHLNPNPDWFESVDDCRRATKQRYALNTRYSLLTQRVFTAGDIQQFSQYRDFSNGTGAAVSLDPSAWTQLYQASDWWKKFRHNTTESVDNTFRYLFDKFKKGIYIKITNNQLKCFLPFSKMGYTNEWGDKMQADPTKYASLTHFLLTVSKEQGYHTSVDHINTIPSTWYANNCLIRYEYPIAENDTGVCVMKDMLTQLCAERVVPDVECFINKRDFPLVKVDDTEPYEHIFGDRTKLLSHRYDSYCPVLSSVTTDHNADVALPTAEDWCRARNQESGVFFPDFCRTYQYSFAVPFRDRIPTAIFRGSSTGCGTTVDTNPRLQLAYLSTLQRRHQGVLLLDAGITKWQLRPRKLINQPYLQTIDRASLPFGLVPEMSPEQQARYKYVVNVDGHTSAFRLSLELSMGSVILLQHSKYRTWYRPYLKPYEHYVPLESDLSDLFDQIRWCREHEAECEEIARNARRFYETYLTRSAILDFMQNLMFDLKKNTGEFFYNIQSVRSVITDLQCYRLRSLTPPVPASNRRGKRRVPSFHQYPFATRCVNAMNGLRLFLDKALPDLVLLQGQPLYISHDRSCYVSPCDLDRAKLVVKQQHNNPLKVPELINEAFVGLFCINELIREIPNFRYTYHLTIDERRESGRCVFERIDGYTFKDYLVNGHCSIGQYIRLLQMLTLSLLVAQERCGFVHYDLYPWNVIVQELPEPQTFVYQFKNFTFTVDTNVVPVIVDYGKANVIYDSTHFGTLKPFEFSSIQDVYSIVITSAYEMHQRRRDTAVLTEIVRFFQEDLSEKELPIFLSTAKKFNDMIYMNKFQLKSRTPFAFLLHLDALTVDVDSTASCRIAQVNYPHKAPCTFVPYLHPVLYYTLIVGHDPAGPLRDYLATMKHAIDTFAAASHSLFSWMYILNMYQMSLVALRFYVREFCPTAQSIHALIDELVAVTAWLAKEGAQQQSHSSVVVPCLHAEYVPSMYTVDTFSNPSKILTLLQGVDQTPSHELLALRKMVVWNLFFELPLRIPPTSELELAARYKGLVKLAPFNVLNFNANHFTLRLLSKIIYTTDVCGLTRRVNPPSKILNTMRAILDIL